MTEFAGDLHLSNSESKNRLKVLPGPNAGILSGRQLQIVMQLED